MLNKIHIILCTKPARIINYKINSIQKSTNNLLNLTSPYFVYRYTKVYGLLRCGTNYLYKLLDLNFKTTVFGPTELGWKHGPCQYEAYTDFIFISKNPYSWIISLKNWEEIHSRIGNISLTEFLKSPISHPQFREAWNVKRLIEAWNISHR